MYSNDVLTVQPKGHLAPFVMWLTFPCLASFQFGDIISFFKRKKLTLVKCSENEYFFFFRLYILSDIPGLVRVYREGFLAI